MGKLDTMDREEVIYWVLKFQHECGGFSGNVGHDPHIISRCYFQHFFLLFSTKNIHDKELGSSGQGHLYENIRA